MKTSDQFAPNIFVIFGGAGDLTWRKLMPALFDLSQSHSIPAHFAIIVVDRVELSADALRKRLHEGVKKFARAGKSPVKEWTEFSQHIRYLQGDCKSNATYKELSDQCASLEKEWDSKAQRIFYMATPPSLFGEIPSFLNYAGLAADRERGLRHIGSAIVTNFCGRYRTGSAERRLLPQMDWPRLARECCRENTSHSGQRRPTRNPSEFCKRSPQVMRCKSGDADLLPIESDRIKNTLRVHIFAANPSAAVDRPKDQPSRDVSRPDLRPAMCRHDQWCTAR